MRLRRVLLAVLALAVLLPVLAVAAVAVLFDGEALKPYAVAAVRRATGRELTIAGPVRLGWSLRPTVTAEGVALANPPGLSRPAMALLQRVEARVALWPLLSRQIEVLGVTLVGPDVLLERDAAGQGNWVFARPAAPATDAASTASASAPSMQVRVDEVQVRDGRVGWRSGGRVVAMAVPALSARTEGAGTVRVAGKLDLNGTGFEVQGTTGALGTAGGAWPVDLSLTGAGATLRAAGAVGANVGLTAEIAGLAALSPLAGRPLPPLRDLKAAAQLGPAGLSAFQMQAAGDLGGLRLTRFDLTAAAPDQPLHLVAEATSAGGPVRLTATTASPASLLQPGPAPLQARLEAAGAAITADGAADLRTAAFDAQVSARVPDLQALGAAFGVGMPRWRDVTLDMRAAAAPAPAPEGGIALRGMRLVLPGADMAGDVVVSRSPRPAMRGSLVSQRLDLDVLAIGTAPPAPAVAPGTAAPPGTATPPAAPDAPAHLLRDTPLPFDALRRADADLQLAVNEAVWHGTVFRAVSARLLLQDGRLRLDPVQGQAPGGPVSAALTADAATSGASLSLQAPGLAAGPLLAALSGSDSGSGALDLDVDLHAQGASPRAMAGTLDGHAGLALVDGEFDVGGLLALLGDAVPKGLPVQPGGRSKVRCLALRMDIAKGQATLGTLLLDATRLHLTGDGTANLQDETLDLHLRPQVRLGLGGVSVPVRVTGPFRAPRAQAEIKGGAGIPGLLIGAPPPPDECGPRLDAARGGRPGSAPASAPEAARSKPADLLRNLFR